MLQGDSVEDEHTKQVNGIPVTLNVLKGPLHDQQGNVTGLCGIARDVTERRTAERGRPSSQRFTVGAVDPKYPSRIMSHTLDVARAAAAADSIILLLGESGSGKDYLARFIHYNSRRSGGPYFMINCASVAPELAESELFGHESGAFTGANKRKRGLLELAEGGTLLLNEVGELPLRVQAKLLTFLDTREFTRVGGEKNISVDARLLAATNRDLQSEIDKGRFRQDLFYRINVFSINVPSLRERLEDLPILVEQMLTLIAAKMQLANIPSLEPVAMRTLYAYNWPGNVRELRNVLERGIILSGDGRIKSNHLGLSRHSDDWSLNVPFPKGRSLNDITAEIKQSLLMEALRRCDGNRTKAARLLGISRHSVINYLKSQ